MRPRRRHAQLHVHVLQPMTMADSNSKGVGPWRRDRQEAPSQGRIRASKRIHLATKASGPLGGIWTHHVLVLACLLANMYMYSYGGGLIQRGGGVAIVRVEAVRLPFLPNMPALSRRKPARRLSMGDVYGVDDVQVDGETIDAYRRATLGHNSKFSHGRNVPRGGAAAAGLWGSPPEDDSSDIEDGSSNNMAPTMPEMNNPYGGHYDGVGGGAPDQSGADAPPPPGDNNGPPLPPGPGDGYAPNGGMPPPRMPGQGPQQQGGYGQRQQQQQQQYQQGRVQNQNQNQGYGPPAQQGGGYGPPSQYGDQQQYQHQPPNQYGQQTMPTSNTGGPSPTVLDIDSHDPSQQQSQQQQPDLSNFDKDMIFNGLKKMYKKKILPVEHMSQFTKFGTSQMSASDFTAKPMVLLLGQYR